MVVLAAGACGDADATVAEDWELHSTAHGEYASAGALLRGTPGAGYKLCWGFAPSDASEYLFEVGPFELSQYLEGPFYLATPEHNSSALLDLDTTATGIAFSHALGLPEEAVSVSWVEISK